jgi:hypothetical protein
MTNNSGSYQFLSLPAGGTYYVTPNKAARTPASFGIDTIDAIATQRHFLQIVLLTGCRLQAADVSGNNIVDTIDVIAIQRFFLGETTGTANVGKYRFSPASYTYPVVITDQTNQNYNALVFGDVASPFAEP